MLQMSILKFAFLEHTIVIIHSIPIFDVCLGFHNPHLQLAYDPHVVMTTHKCGCVDLFTINLVVRSISAGARRRDGTLLNVIAPFNGP